MNNIVTFPQKERQSKSCPNPSSTALSVMAICGGDFAFQQARGPMTCISWANDELASKALFIIDEARRECGNEAQYSVELITLNYDGTAAQVFLDLDTLQSDGGEPPSDLPIMTRYQGDALLIEITTAEAAA
ncbi:hypothetical protein [Vreelandella maris]|uniref:hypothetical protein n=1 Tax=Vreelandella maris TaxID=2729617 RepID=UPI0030EF8B67|tara:strand:- start:120 stop:515 length:396 start_codon:yes stop_codon:yes gene_type:complete